MKDALIEDLVQHHPDMIKDEIGKKPVLLEAMQLTGSGPHDIKVYQWVEQYVGGFGAVTLRGESKGISVDPKTGFMLIATPKGVIEAEPGDFIIHAVTGEFRAMKGDVFRATYESALIDDPALYPNKKSHV